uniref:IRG-type G domain-containing protein n=1 Tax=Cyprinus carpio carpio TaxID=630221 RepID=A0A8C1BUB4_CYPCA
MEKQPEKPKHSSSLLDIVESKLNDVKEREREKKQSDKKKQAEKEVIHITNETTVDQSEKAEMCHFDMIQMAECLEEQNEQTEAEEPCKVTTEEQHMREKKQSDKEKHAEKEGIHIINETTVDQSEKTEMCHFDMIQMEKCLEEQNEQTETEVPCEVTTEEQHMREKKQSDKEKQAEKEVIHIINETTVDQSEKTEMCHFDMIHMEKCLEEQNEQTETEEPCEVTTEEQHVKAVDKEEQREPEISVPMTNEEAKGMTECGKATDIHKTKQPDSVETDHFQESQAAIMEKDVLTEKPNKINLSEPSYKVTTKAENEEVMEIQKEELLSGVVCPDAKKSQDDTDKVFLCKAKENMHLKSESTEKRESINTTTKKQEEEHVYEVPDVMLTSSAEYVYPAESVKEQLKKLDNVTLHIAVTGSTGAGKSSFINAIRGLQPDDVNAAPTGVTETTMTSTVYTHPTMPNVKLWDLPGTGSPKFKAKKYLKEVKLNTFDFFIIISSERFKENDIMLAKAIKEKKKLFYFLRSKIDNDIQAESKRKDFDEQKVLSHIREDCHRNLKDVYNPKPEIFLISSFELHKYDFQTLVDTMEKQLPAHKRDALILSLPIYSSKILDEKIELFMKQTWSAAVASGSIAVAPVPGLSIACDAAILLAFFTKCYYAFGLDDKSVDKLSVRVNNQSLKSVRKSPLVIAIGQKKLSNKELSALTNREAAVKFAWSMVPVVGSKKTAEMSYSATLNLLRAGVQDLADTAKEVLKV